MHCLNIRHKGMFVTSGPDPDEFSFYDKYDSTAYWCAETQRGFGPDGAPVRPDCCPESATVANTSPVAAKALAERMIRECAASDFEKF